MTTVWDIAGFLRFRVLPLAALTVLLSYGLSFADWNGAWMPVAYAILVAAAVLALLVNLAPASQAGAMFHLLWRWQQQGSRFTGSALRRALWVVVPPWVVVCGVVMVAANLSVSMQLAALVPALTVIIGLLVVVRDSEVSAGELDRGIHFPSAAAVVLATSVVAIAVILTVYFVAGVPTVLPDHNLVESWEID